ncbi:MAG TPA: tetratricopeptide repeat protein [Kofleriaceae bacterium]
MVTPAPGREALDQAIVRGSDLLKQGKLGDAQGAFRAALELEPDNPRVLALLGLSYFRGNQFADAQPIYETLVEKAPTDASHRLNLGLVYLKLNNAERAIDALEASRALDPSQGRAVSYLGLAYARAGRYAEAYRSFLLAGQNELATEIEVNLTPAERDGIHGQLGRTPSGPLPVVARTVTPPPPPQPASKQKEAEPRTKPPSAPPRRAVELESGKVIPGHERSAAATGLGTGMLSSPEITLLASESSQFPRIDEIAITSARPERVSDSMQFVIPKADPVAAPLDGQSMVSMAVAAVVPAAVAPTRTAAGGVPPRPLSEIATEELIRPDDGNDPFEIMPGGALIVRVSERVFTRLDGVHVTGGDLAYEMAMRRSRGHQIEERFDQGGSPLHAVTGKGYLIATLGQREPRGMFVAVELDDDILYLREDLVFAFESTLRWENGNVPGLRGKLHVVQFRGDGALAMRLQRPLVRVKLPPQGLVFVDAERLAGWIGRVIPRAVVPPVGGPLGTTCVECTGEGIVLVEPAPPPSVVPVAAVEPPVEAVSEPVAEAKPEIDPELAAFAAGFDDDKI